jgi:uncharacterized membrane protein
MDYDPDREEYRHQHGRPNKDRGSRQEYETRYQQEYERRASRQGYNLDDPLGPTAMKLNPKISAALSYVLWWITGLIFLVAERKNRFVRFHAIQSILTFIVVSIAWALVRFVFSLPVIHLLGYFLIPTLGLIVFIIWLSLIVLALLGKAARVPVIGDFAARMAGYNRLSGRHRPRHIEPGL